MKHVAPIKVKALAIGLPGKSVSQLTFDAQGIQEDPKHYGPTLISGPRVRIGAPRVPKGEIDENWRMFSAMSVEEIQAIRQAYEVQFNRSFEGFDGKLMGVNLTLQGVADLTNQPVGSILDFEQDGPTLCISSENTPCKMPGAQIATRFGLPKIEARRFVEIAKGRRGIVGKVLKPGILTPGMSGALYHPGF